MDYHYIFDRKVLFPIEYQTFKFTYSGKMDTLPVFPKEDLYIADCNDKEELEGLGFFENDEVEQFINDPSIYIYRINGEYIACGTFLKPYWRTDIPDSEKNSYRDIGMHVSPNHRYKGYGRSMVQNLTLIALEQGFIPLTECTVENTASRTALESAGYVLQ